MPFLIDKNQRSPHQALFWRLEEADHLWAVRTPNAKYMNQSLPGVGLSFFDMKNDPTEKNNLVNKLPEQQSALAKLWNDWNQGNTNNLL